MLKHENIILLHMIGNSVFYVIAASSMIGEEVNEELVDEAENSDKTSNEINCSRNIIHNLSK